MKSYTTKYSCVSACTVEQNKFDMYEEANDASQIKETVALQYDANMIMYIWNELNCKREHAYLYTDSSVLEYSTHEQKYLHRKEKKPILKVKFLKNKLSEFKGDLYFSAHPELAMIIPMPMQEAWDLVKARKEEHERYKAAAKEAKKNQ
jgi:hypothetical protein